MEKIKARVKNVWSYMGWDDHITVPLFVFGILGSVIKPLPFDPVLNEIYWEREQN